jgi:glycosyltransferase involved in cell wall biosynthesis
MSNPRIALAMIVKWDELDLLKTCLDSVIDYVDYAHVSVNYPSGVTHDEAEQAVLEFSKNYKKVDFNVSAWTNFGEARNRNLKLIAERNYDFYLWLDVDDTVQNPEKLRQVCLATPDHISGVYMPYDYQHDEFGNVTVQHYVARLIRNNGTFAWSNKILHETLEPIRQTGKAMNDEVKVIHHADDERRDRSLLRNIGMLEKELAGEGDNPDPRTLYYLGTTLIDVGRTEESKQLLGRYLQMSGYAEERSQAWVHIGNMYFNEGDGEQARGCYIHAVTENPKDAVPCVELAKLEMTDQLWDKAIEWLNMALAKKEDPMSTTVFSTETRYRTYMYLADCYMSQGGKGINKAKKYALKALEMRPDDATRDYYDHTVKISDHIKQAEGVVLTLKELEETEQKANILPLINSLPASLRDNPAILRFQKRNQEPKKWPKKSIVIFTGNSAVGEWGPWSLKDGVGGSEEAVVRLSRQLKKQGWTVAVYGNPGIKAGDYDGVQWYNYWELNLADTFDVFVGWRMPWFFDIKMNARKKYLWLHDVMDKEEFTKERIDNIDKVIVLSKYHRSLYDMVPDEKIFLSANGIDPEEFEKTDGQFVRDPHTVIYQSSHVRGLQLLYEIWPGVLKEVPEAQLRIMYGWGSYDTVNRGNPERLAWKESMIKKLAGLKNAVDLGKVSQEQIVRETQQAGIWAYPCPFPEISCITAMKAQAGGATPVSSNFAALEETVQAGIKIPMEAVDPKKPVGDWDDSDVETYKNALIKMLKHPQSAQDRQKMMTQTRQGMSWAAVAKGWIDEFSA